MTAELLAPGYEIRLRFACGCVDRWTVATPPHPDDVETITSDGCPTTTWASVVPSYRHDGTCEAHR